MFYSCRFCSTSPTGACVLSSRQAASALRRRCISSTETFSLCVEIVHVLPNGSSTRPSREPKNISVMGLNTSAPASTACAKTASESATKIWASKLCSGHPSMDSPKFTRESPNLNSQCVTFPLGKDRRRISSAPNARCRKIPPHQCFLR
jgi:hypothetical protein